MRPCALFLFFIIIYHRFLSFCMHCSTRNEFWFFFFVALLLLAPLSFEPELQFFGGVVIFSSSLSSTFFFLRSFVVHSFPRDLCFLWFWIRFQFGCYWCWPSAWHDEHRNYLFPFFSYEKVPWSMPMAKKINRITCHVEVLGSLIFYFCFFWFVFFSSRSRIVIIVVTVVPSVCIVFYLFKI